MSEDERASITIRLPSSMLDELRASAKMHSHSANAEIVQRLRKTLLEESIPIDHDEFDKVFLKAAETYIMCASDDAIMRLLAKRFRARER
ncbi:Arc family DNA-binding protein [Gluconacetobacter entanii]|nr:Arc family DNA-binding protein [Gluconacetobacter entanii]